MRAKVFAVAYIVVLALASFVVFVPVIPQNIAPHSTCLGNPLSFLRFAFPQPGYVSASFYLFGVGGVLISTCNSTVSFYWYR